MVGIDTNNCKVSSIVSNQMVSITFLIYLIFFFKSYNSRCTYKIAERLRRMINEIVIAFLSDCVNFYNFSRFKFLMKQYKLIAL